MRQQAYGYAAVTLFCLGIAPVAQAELKPISDETMGEVTGQGFIQIENIPGDPHQFTRMTLSMDVETRMNVDDVKAGEIDGGVDFAAQHVALGHIAVMTAFSITVAPTMPVTRCLLKRSSPISSWRKIPPRAGSPDSAWGSGRRGDLSLH